MLINTIVANTSALTPNIGKNIIHLIIAKYFSTCISTPSKFMTLKAIIDKATSTVIIIQSWLPTFFHLIIGLTISMFIIRLSAKGTNGVMKPVG
jgi:hypothetical protein